VDSHRNFRTDPGILCKAMNPEVLVIRPTRLVVKPGDTADVDVHLINETGRTGAQTLTLTAFNPNGSVLFSQQQSVTATGGDVFGQVLATNFTFVPTTNGVVSLVGSLQPSGGTGDVLTNETDLQVIDPLEGAPLMSRIAVCEVGSQIKSLLSGTFGITPLGTTNLTSSLDAIVLGFSGAPSWSYTAYDVSSSIANTSDPGLYQNQFFGGTGVAQTWFGLAPGNATVQLYFAETYWTATNSRLFDVALNGNTVLTNFDIFQQAGGIDMALIKTFTVNASDGTVSLSFPTVEKDNATIAALKITDASNHVTSVVFSTSSFTDHNGLVWEPLASFPTYSVPVTDAQWQTILSRVSNDGVRLVLWPNNITESMVYVNKLAAGNLLQIGIYDGNTGYLPDNTPPWMGSWYFARQHWVLDDLPVNSVLGWQYQIPHSTIGTGGGLLINAVPSCPMDVMIGYGRDHEAAVAIGAAVIQSGNGEIILPALPRLRDALTYYDGSFLTQPVALRLFGNALRAAPASAPLAPPTLSATPFNNQAVLNWLDAFGATSYNVLRATVSGGPYTLIASNLTTTVCTNSGLLNGTTYYYVVCGVNGTGEGQNSSEAAVTPSPSNLGYGWWKFDETNGATAVDSLGGRNGTLLNGPLWVAGKLGNAVSLNGIDDYVMFPAGLVSPLNDFSVSAWVYLKSVTAWTRVFDFGTGTNVYMELTPQNGDSGVVRYAITINGYDGEQQINGTAALPTGVWTHVAVTLCGTTGTLYVNGAAVGANYNMTLEPSSLGSTTQNNVGKSQFPSDPYLNGLADDLRIYARALSPAEVFALANPTTAPAAPAGLSAKLGSSQVGLNWNASSGATSYLVKLATVSGGPYAVVDNVTTTNYTDAGLTNGTTYFYVVTAVDAAGESANSLEVSATPGTLNLRPGALSGNGLALSWSNGAASLYQTFSLIPPVNWTLVTNPPVFSNGLWNLNLPIGTNRSSFYRLAY
jgi:hypothetical protein